jgi:hypothetical protein
MKKNAMNRPLAPMFVPVVAVLGALAATLFSVTALTTAASADSTRITEPSGTYHVALDASGKALPVTVVATGFQPGTNVFVEECDGRAPSEPNWSPTADCDLGNAPAPAIADSTGTARFLNTDHNRLFVPIVGAGPSGLFSCIAPHATPPATLTSYTKCQIRVSTNNTAATEDQVFRPVVIGTSGGSGGGSGTAATAGVIAAVIVVGAIVVGTVLWLRRRKPADARRR